MNITEVLYGHTGTDRYQYLEYKYLYIIYYKEHIKYEEIRVSTMYNNSVLVIRISI